MPCRFASGTGQSHLRLRDLSPVSWRWRPLASPGRAACTYASRTVNTMASASFRSGACMAACVAWLAHSPGTFGQAGAVANSPGPIATFPNAAVIARHTNLRVGPGAQHGVVAVMAPGELVQILGSAGEWMQVRRAKDWSQRGWILDDQVKRLQPVDVPRAALPSVAPQPQPATR